jgi:hypothetical protein
MSELKNINLKLIKPLTWPDVFAIWRQNEDYPDSHWIKLWQERGFKSWQDWRASYIKPLGLDELPWGLYEITDPLQAIPLFHGGSFRSWIKMFYQGRDNPTFTELAEKPEIQAHQGILNMLASFPAQTTITAVVINDEAYVVEGMHRCAALALAAKQGKKLDTRVKVALAQYNQDKLPIVGKGQKY